MVFVGVKLGPVVAVTVTVDGTLVTVEVAAQVAVLVTVGG